MRVSAPRLLHTETSRLGFCPDIIQGNEALVPGTALCAAGWQHVWAKFLLFSVFTFLGCLPWCILLVWMGDTAGSNWEDWQEKLHLLDYPIIVALAALVALWLLRRWRRRAG